MSEIKKGRDDRSLCLFMHGAPGGDVCLSLYFARRVLEQQMSRKYPGFLKSLGIRIRKMPLVPV